MQHKFGHYRGNCFCFVIFLMISGRAKQLLIRWQNYAPHFLVTSSSGNIVHVTLTRDILKPLFFEAQIHVFDRKLLRKQNYLTISNPFYVK